MCSMSETVEYFGGDNEGRGIEIACPDGTKGMLYKYGGVIDWSVLDRFPPLPEGEHRILAADINTFAVMRLTESGLQKSKAQLLPRAVFDELSEGFATRNIHCRYMCTDDRHWQKFRKWTQEYVTSLAAQDVAQGLPGWTENKKTTYYSKNAAEIMRLYAEHLGPKRIKSATHRMSNLLNHLDPAVQAYLDHSLALKEEQGCFFRTLESAILSDHLAMRNEIDGYFESIFTSDFVARHQAAWDLLFTGTWWAMYSAYAMIYDQYGERVTPPQNPAWLIPLTEREATLHFAGLDGGRGTSLSAPWRAGTTLNKTFLVGKPEIKEKDALLNDALDLMLSVGPALSYTATYGTTGPTEGNTDLAYTETRGTL